uniref:Ribosomal RNA methyltransferase FtsJ domain-containing protein n=1 Tax=viral metagenome TaxID=1070528 RepID=A0A6C0H683_9ZZZZ
MNYFIIPKNNCNLNIFLKFNDKPVISHTCIYYFNTLKNIADSIDKDLIIFLNISTVDYSYYIFNLIEIVSTFFIFNFNFNITIYSLNNIESLLTIFRKNFSDQIIQDNLISFDLGFFSIKEENYKNMKSTMNHLLFKQKKNGVSIIKINSIFLQHTLDFIFVLSIIYDKVIIFKPKINNHLSFEKYIICKGFNPDFKFKPILCYFNKKPLHFIKKIEEINAIITNIQSKTIYDFLQKIDYTSKDILENNNTIKYLEWASTYIPNNNI